MVPDSKRWPVRFNLRLSEDTAAAYREFAELSGIDMTTALRTFVDGSVPAVEAMSAAIRQAQLGNAEQAARLVQTFANKVMADGQHYQAQTDALVEEVKGKVGKQA